MTELSIVVAVYNEEAVLRELHRRLSAALQISGKTYEIILVDDGSRDRSLAIMQELRTLDPQHVRPLSFTRNFGHHIALTAGLDQAEGAIVIMMDADLQDQPEEIAKLLAKLEEGYDVVWGERATRQFSWYKNLSSRMFLWLMNSVARSEVPLNSSIFRAMRRPVADDLRKMREQARYLPGLVSWLGYRETSVPVEHGARFAGETKYSLWRLIKLALSTATSFSTAPLQLATVSGMITAAIAVLFVLYILARKFTGVYTVPGYASVMIAIFVFGALQLIVIGLMGEYVSRIYREAQGRPLYLLRDLGSRSITAPESTLPSTSLRPAIIEDLWEVMALDPELPLAHVFHHPNSDALANYHLQSWNRESVKVISEARDGFKVVCIFEELAWDSKLLGVKAGRIHYANALCESQERESLVSNSRANALRRVLGACLANARSRGIQLIDARVSGKDQFLTRAFEAEGFHTVDSLVTLGADRSALERITRDGHANPMSSIRPMQSSEEAVLAQISYDAFGDFHAIQDRFFLEPAISHERSQVLFREWFLNLSRKAQSDQACVLVAELDGKPAGYIALEPMAPFDGLVWWRDSLNAVASEARGRGVYRALIRAAFEYVQNAGGAGLITKTQGSTNRVINSWLHAGGGMLESFTTLHWTPS
ncbi:MAG: GNAT family N-acetyltransferase [Bacteroidota bacterium]|nr:GNAT family N-acetyltransferase [Bacteroidota bacterium]MDP4232869.1 GNAT family N-acetyltransferase [Bacteroidota bacterium]MDP4241913.1 GNAT family N-acetyltransferase [Bacteroidota bacterium]MDP4288238.1 GNAT family N-acetyltransferase [Bacteroidota bacterium]